MILISVLLGYLSLGAYVLMRLETHAELVQRSRKLVRLSQLFNNLTIDSWRTVQAQQRGGTLKEVEWTAQFREYLTQVTAEKLFSRDMA